MTLGYNVTNTTDNSVFIGAGGNFISNTFTSNATWSHSSDGRLKENVNDDTLGLSFINDLRPVTYNWKKQKDVDENLRDSFEKDTENLQHGMIAQDVKAALDKAGVDTFAGWSVDSNKGIEQISEEMFVFPLIKAVQELSKEIEELKKDLHKPKGLKDMDGYDELMAEIKNLKGE
jgi:ribosomal protein S15P/S13E